jgi:hypothetical protein
MVLFIGDEEFFEGLLGGFGWILSSLFFKKSQKGNPIIIGVSAWMILWFTRKIGMRIYIQWRKHKLDKNDGVNIVNFTNLSDNKFKLLAFISLYLSIMGYCYYTLSENKFSSSLNSKDISLISIIMFLLFYIYLQ